MRGLPKYLVSANLIDRVYQLARIQEGYHLVRLALIGFGHGGL